MTTTAATIELAPNVNGRFAWMVRGAGFVVVGSSASMDRAFADARDEAKLRAENAGG